MATDRRLQRERLYSAGAKAFARVAASTTVFQDHPEVEGWYVCPLCLHAFPKEALNASPPVLTIDETPPKASARASITKVLTCAPCNNRAGGRFERELKRRRDVEDFAGGELDTPITIGLEVGDGIYTRAAATIKDGVIRFVGRPEASQPEAVSASREWWDRQVDEGITDSQFRVALPGFDPHKSSVALLKAAYLAAFAAFGYRYIGRPSLDVVRSEVAEPGAHLARIPTLISTELDVTEHRLLIARSPITALAIQIGQEVVFLPWLTSPADFWERISDRTPGTQERTTVTFDASGTWPSRPEYRLDERQSARLGECDLTGWVQG